MQLIEGVHALRKCHRGCVATIGNFDGVHLGHREMIREVIRQAGRHGGASCVVIFEPLPGEVMDAGGRLLCIQSIEEKLEALQHLGVDQVLQLTFDDELMGCPQEQFVRQVLVEGLGVRHLIVGDDFRFGCERAGSFATLVAAGAQYGFSVAETPTVSAGGERVSSTRIRGLLEQSQFGRARALLGRAFVVSGTVVKGRQLGRRLGVPTANLPWAGRCLPADGVYAVRVHGLERLYGGVANVGPRPTIALGDRQLEVHLFDFCGDLYGRTLAVEFVDRMRGQRQFESLQGLSDAIANDIKSARRCLKNQLPSGGGQACILPSAEYET